MLFEDIDLLLLKRFKYYDVWLLKSNFISVTEENPPSV